MTKVNKEKDKQVNKLYTATQVLSNTNPIKSQGRGSGALEGKSYYATIN